MPPARLTIRDVAKHAGVSHQTVSRVINGDPLVTPETRAKVEAAIAELGYQPNAIARSLAAGRSKTLACLAPNLTDYTFARIIEGAEAECRQHGFFLISSSAPDEATFAALINELAPSRRIEGVLVINPYIDNRAQLLPKNFPVVFVGGHPRDGLDVDAITLDDEGAARSAVQHLIGLGHNRIAMITGPLIEDCTQDRITGYRAALKKAKIKFAADLIVAGDWSASSAHAALLAIDAESTAAHRDLRAERSDGAGCAARRARSGLARAGAAGRHRAGRYAAGLVFRSAADDHAAGYVRHRAHGGAAARSGGGAAAGEASTTARARRIDHSTINGSDIPQGGETQPAKNTRRVK